MDLHKVLQHLWHLPLEVQAVLGDGGGGQAAEGGELQRVDLAAGDGLEEVGGALGAGVAGVDVGAVRQKKLNDLDGKKVIHSSFWKNATVDLVGKKRKSIANSSFYPPLRYVPYLLSVVGRRAGDVQRRAGGVVGGVDLGAALYEQPGHPQGGEEVLLAVLEQVLALERVVAHHDEVQQGVAAGGRPGVDRVDQVVDAAAHGKLEQKMYIH